MRQFSQLHHNYVNGFPEIFSSVIPYVEGNGYTSLEHYIDCMGRPVNKSPDRGRSWGELWQYNGLQRRSK